MPIQPTNFFGMNQQLGRDIGNIPGSIVQGAKQGAELGLMFDKFRKAEDDQKAFQEVKSDFMRQIRTDMADDSRGERILALAARARSMPEIAGLAKELIVAQNAEKTTKSKLKFDANMLAHDGGGELYAKMAKEQETKAEAEAKKAETEAAGQSARQKAEQPGFDPKQLSKQEFQAQGKQLQMSFDEQYRQDRLDIDRKSNQLRDMKRKFDDRKLETDEANNAIRMMGTAQAAFRAAGRTVSDAKTALTKIMNPTTDEGRYAKDDQKKAAIEALDKAQATEKEAKEWVGMIKELHMKKVKDLDEAKKELEKAKEAERTAKGTIQRAALVEAMRTGQGGVPTIDAGRAPIQSSSAFQPTALPGTTAVAGTPQRRRGTGF